MLTGTIEGWENKVGRWVWCNWMYWQPWQAIRGLCADWADQGTFASTFRTSASWATCSWWRSSLFTEKAATTKTWVAFWYPVDHYNGINLFTPESDQFQISPAASPALLHHTTWRTWLFIAYSNERSLYLLLHHLFNSIWQDVLFELGSERVKPRVALH